MNCCTLTAKVDNGKIEGYYFDMELKRKIYGIINENPFFLVFIQSLIIINMLAVMLESVSYLHKNYGPFFYWFEVVSVAIFTIEYLARVWSADFGTMQPIKRRLKFIFSFLGLIDLVAILPFYLPFLITFDLRFLRIMRLVRLFRVFKIARYSMALKLIGKVLKRKKEEIFLTLFITFLLLIVASSFMFYVEHEAQPEEFTNIFQSLWWAVATLTTIGYGDIYPVTVLGKLLSAIIAILGIGLVALPTGIISSGFIETIKENRKPHICPHCGKEIAQ
jgi:voltage-gated potassium channel